MHHKAAQISVQTEIGKNSRFPERINIDMIYQLHRDNEEYFRFGRCLCYLHFHKAIELIYCIKKQKPIIIGSKETTLEEGELLFVPPLVSHGFPVVDEHHALCIVMPVTYSDILKEQIGGKEFKEYIIHDKAVASDIFRHMCMLENCDMPLLKQGLYTYILAMCIKNLPLCERSDKEKADFAVDVLVYIERHYNEKLTSESVAKALGYTPCYFSSLFNQNFKCSFNEYLNGVRIAKTIPMLGKHSLTEIAESVGFSNMQSFYQNFKKVTGTTPTKYSK